LIRAVERHGPARDIAMVSLMLNTGLRVAELAALRWTDLEVRDRSGKLTVRRGKGRKQRTIPLNVEARNALIELRDNRERWGQSKGIAVLRHTWCKNLADDGVRLEVIAALAGHESLETTRRYVEPGHDDLAAAVERIAGGEA
jgi:site-specific recombinase XerD